MTETSASSYLQGKTVLIAGAAGFIGSHLVDKCLSLGATVIGVDNLITGQKINLAHLQDQANFHFLEADVNQQADNYLTPFLEQLRVTQPEAAKIDLVLHFASPASPPIYQQHPIETYLVNSLGTHNLLTYLQANFPQARMVYASSSEVYGDPQVHPQDESYWGNVNPNGPRSCYDEGKRMGETVCGVFTRYFSMDVRIIRIFNTYGPRMRADDGRVLPSFINQALAKQALTVFGDGKQTRSYCFVSDLVNGIMAVASTEGIAGETFNLGNNDEYSVLETAVLVQKIINQEASKEDIVFQELPEDDPTRRQPKLDKAKEVLGWQAQINFREGLDQTIAYFRELGKQNN